MMDSKESDEAFVEDEQVEITDLPNQARSFHPWRERWTRVTVPLLRKRWLQLVALLLLTMLCLTMLVRAAGIQPGLLSSLFGWNVPNDDPSLSIDQFYFNLGPDWAHLSIDGQPVTNAPQVKRGKPLRLAPGVHHLLWQAAPFPPRSCSITIPSHLTDTCATSETTSTPGGERAWIVTFPVTLLTLPPTQRRALTTAITQALTQLEPGDTVYPGEHFVDSQNKMGPVVTARQELNAQMQLTLDNGPDSDQGQCTGGDPNTELCELNGQDCSLLCTEPGNGSNAWQAVALVRSSWTYTTLNGQVVAAQMPDEQGGAAFAKHFLPLSIYWKRGAWSVLPGQQFIYNGGQIPLSCASSADNNAMSTLFGDSPWEAFEWQYLTASNPASGCLLVLTAIANNGPGATATAQIIYLHRFGVLLAVNRLAQEYDPEMPYSDAFETHLAQEIATQGHVPWG